MKPGWGAILRGEPSDLEDWKLVLNHQFDPWIEVHGNDTLLRSKSLDVLSNATDARAKALDMIDYLNGALALSQQTKPVAFGGAVEFSKDGQMHRTIFGQAVQFLRPIRNRATIVAFEKDGKPL